MRLATTFLLAVACSTPALCQLTEYSVSKHGVSDIQFNDEKHGWAVVWDSEHRATLLQTRNGGKSWRPVQAPAHITNAFFLTVRTGWLVLNEQGGWKLHSTKDGGEHWSLVSKLSDPPMLHEDVLLDFRFVNDREGWFLFQGHGTSAEGGLVLSTADGGKTTKPEPSLAGSPFQSSFVSSSKDVWLVGMENRIAGKHMTSQWQIQNPLQYGFAAHWEKGLMLSKTTGFVVGHGPPGTILKTEDGGKSWRSVLESESSSILSDLSFFDTSSGCAVGTSRSLYCTNDTGEHWKELQVLPSPSEPKQFNGFIRILFVNREHAYLVRFGGYIYESLDGGKTWKDAESSFSGRLSFAKTESAPFAKHYGDALPHR